eukprot:scaffold155393_cov25-Tisochrysis_lutea.AAC.1
MQVRDLMQESGLITSARKKDAYDREWESRRRASPSLELSPADVHATISAWKNSHGDAVSFREATDSSR